MTTPRPFRFGVLAGGRDSRQEWLALARRAQALGYSTLLVGDHLHTPMAPLAALVSAAEATTTLRLGCHVFANDLRNPVMLAREAATIDLLSGGPNTWQPSRSVVVASAALTSAARGAIGVCR